MLTGEGPAGMGADQGVELDHARSLAPPFGQGLALVVSALPLPPLVQGDGNHRPKSVQSLLSFLPLIGHRVPKRCGQTGVPSVFDLVDELGLQLVGPVPEPAPARGPVDEGVETLLGFVPASQPGEGARRAPMDLLRCQNTAAGGAAPREDGRE